MAVNEPAVQDRGTPIWKLPNEMLEKVFEEMSSDPRSESFLGWKLWPGKGIKHLFPLLLTCRTTFAVAERLLKRYKSYDVASSNRDELLEKFKRAERPYQREKGQSITIDRWSAMATKTHLLRVEHNERDLYEKYATSRKDYRRCSAIMVCKSSRLTGSCDCLVTWDRYQRLENAIMETNIEIAHLEIVRYSNSSDEQTIESTLLKQMIISSHPHLLRSLSISGGRVASGPNLLLLDLDYFTGLRSLKLEGETWDNGYYDQRQTDSKIDHLELHNCSMELESIRGFLQMLPRLKIFVYKSEGSQEDGVKIRQLVKEIHPSLNYCDLE